MLDEKFDYGKIEIGHRLNINKPINHDKRIIEYGIIIGAVQKVKNDKAFWEIQIVYRDENHKSQCDCFDLDDFTIKILHKGNMSMSL